MDYYNNIMEDFSPIIIIIKYMIQFERSILSKLSPNDQTQSQNLNFEWIKTFEITSQNTQNGSVFFFFFWGFVSLLVAPYNQPANR